MVEGVLEAALKGVIVGLPLAIIVGVLMLIRLSNERRKKGK
ncbi:hypothetical protein ACFLTP_09065 [Chloroflexota bacterium]